MQNTMKTDWTGQIAIFVWSWDFRDPFIVDGKVLDTIIGFRHFTLGAMFFFQSKLWLPNLNFGNIQHLWWEHPSPCWWNSNFYDRIITLNCKINKFWVARSTGDQNPRTERKLQMLIKSSARGLASTFLVLDCLGCLLSNILSDTS